MPDAQSQTMLRTVLFAIALAFPVLALADITGTASVSDGLSNTKER